MDTIRLSIDTSFEEEEEEKTVNNTIHADISILLAELKVDIPPERWEVVFKTIGSIEDYIYTLENRLK